VRKGSTSCGKRDDSIKQTKKKKREENPRRGGEGGRKKEKEKKDKAEKEGVEKGVIREEEKNKKCKIIRPARHSKLAWYPVPRQGDCSLNPSRQPDHLRGADPLGAPQAVETFEQPSPGVLQDYAAVRRFTAANFIAASPTRRMASTCVQARTASSCDRSGSRLSRLCLFRLTPSLVLPHRCHQVLPE